VGSDGKEKTVQFNGQRELQTQNISSVALESRTKKEKSEKND
jgi:hypothetical protein